MIAASFRLSQRFSVSRKKAHFIATQTRNDQMKPSMFFTHKIKSRMTNVDGEPTSSSVEVNASNGIQNEQPPKTTEQLEREYLAYTIEEFKSFQGADNFNRIAAKVIPVYASKEKLTCELTIGPEHINTKNTLHGGQTASLIDIVTARAVGITVQDKGMASIELGVSYLLPIKLGDTISITATVLKCGRTVAFTDCEFRQKESGKLCVKGKHTLALLPGSPPVVNGKLAQF